uniref:Uncharacterized protein n=1 Tax=Schizaphis graminum TaxID=13262 RepID=A0A2S2PMD6_SCHGA
MLYRRAAAGHSRAAALKAPRKEKSVINYLRVVYTERRARLRPYVRIYDIASPLRQRVVITILYIHYIIIHQSASSSLPSAVKSEGSGDNNNIVQRMGIMAKAVSSDRE